jgi:beta-lactam-binding protein with PASTA domain
MSVCRKCGTPNDEERDFCSECGEYLRWDPTGFQQSVAPADPEAPAPAPAPPPGQAPGAAAAPPPPARGPYQEAPAPPQAPAQARQEPQPPQDAVLLAVRLPADEGYTGGPVTAKVEPGGQTALIALIRNQSGIVDNYDMAVTGISEEWWTITPTTVYLVPYGSRDGTYEQEVEIRLHPPRSAEAEARPWEINVVARSRAYSAEVGSTAATVEIAPYRELETALRPEVRGGRLKGDFTLAIANRANAPVDVALSAVDPENACRFTFREPPGATLKRPTMEHAEGMVRQAEQLGVGYADVQQMGRRALEQVAAGEIPGERLLRRRPLPAEIQAVRLDPGERAEASVSVSPPRQIWIGRSSMRPFQVVAQPVGTDTPGPPTAGTFRQKPWLPWWLLILIPLIIVGVIWFLSTRTQEGTVPDLTQAGDITAAQGLLQKAGLELGEKTEKPTDQAKAGSIIEQAPKAGEKAKKGSKVSVTLAVASDTVGVPDLTGKNLTEATALLGQAGLQLTPPSPAPSDPNTAVIKSQLPGATPPNPPVNKGGAVQVFLDTGAGTPTTTTGTASTAPTTPTSPTATSPTTPTTPSTSTGSTPTNPVTTQPSTPTQAPSGGGGGVRMPPVQGLTSAKLATLIGGLGAAPLITSQFNDQVKAGSVVSQTPQAGTPVTPATKVQIVVSAGIPDVVYDRCGDILRVGGADHRPKPPLAQTGEVEREPSFTPDGKLLVYQRGPAGTACGEPSSAQIWALDPSSPQTSAHPLTNAVTGVTDGRPAVASDGKAVAFVSDRGGNPQDTDLCFTTVTSAQAGPACIPDPNTIVDRPAWSPDGKAIVVTAADLKDRQTELMLYTSQKPFSTTPSDWVNQGLITDSMHGHRQGQLVFSSAFSPDGSRLAFSANWQGNTPTLYFAKVSGGQIGPKARRIALVAACELSWRSDNAELLVSQREGNCDGKGHLVRVDAAHPGRTVTLTPFGSESGDPIYTPTAP